ncbi:hypothetical protein H311_00244 [Anncaliia algerae PRA109]|nr:hypothetical protein H311_00244 [Anncaliia algerae PRA109]
MSREYWNDRSVAITGGASGLGHMLSMKLALLGAIVTIIDRAQDPKFDNFKYKYVKKDISADLSELYGEHYDVFISNAAIFTGMKPFNECTDEEIKNYVAINVLAPTLLLRNINCEKHVIINSVASLAGLKNMGLYSASKAFMRILNESVRREGRSTLIYCPFKINTQLFKEMNDKFVLDVNDVAEDIIKSIENNSSEIYKPFYYRLTFLLGYLPMRLTDRMYQSIYNYFSN